MTRSPLHAGGWRISGLGVRTPAEHADSWASRCWQPWTVTPSRETSSSHHRDPRVVAVGTVFGVVPRLSTVEGFRFGLRGVLRLDPDDDIGPGERT